MSNIQVGQQLYLSVAHGRSHLDEYELNERIEVLNKALNNDIQECFHDEAKDVETLINMSLSNMGILFSHSFKNPHIQVLSAKNHAWMKYDVDVTNRMYRLMSDLAPKSNRKNSPNLNVLYIRWNNALHRVWRYFVSVMKIFHKTFVIRRKLQKEYQQKINIEVYAQLRNEMHHAKRRELAAFIKKYLHNMEFQIQVNRVLERADVFQDVMQDVFDCWKLNRSIS